MKKIAITLLIMTMTVSLISCGKGKVDKNNPENNILLNLENDKSEKDKLENDKSEKDKESSAEGKQPIEISENNESQNDESKNNGEPVNEPVKEETPTSDPVTENTQSQSQEASRNCRLFFYDGAEDSIYYKDTVVKVVDKAVTKALTSGLKSSPGGNFLVIPSNVEVISAELDGDSITVNLSSSYYDFSSSLGSAADIGMLESLALTYSYNYNVSNVRILVGGQNYTSGHLYYGDNEYIKIDHIESKAL